MENIELSTYRAGEENIPANALSRVKSMSLTLDKLYELNESIINNACTPLYLLFLLLSVAPNQFWVILIKEEAVERLGVKTC